MNNTLKNILLVLGSLTCMVIMYKTLFVERFEVPGEPEPAKVEIPQADLKLCAQQEQELQRLKKEVYDLKQNEHERLRQALLSLEGVKEDLEKRNVLGGKTELIQTIDQSMDEIMRTQDFMLKMGK